MILRLKDAEGNIHDVLAIKGKDGKDYVLTEADKQEIAGMVSIPDTSKFLTEEQVLELIRANMPVNGDEESY